MACGEAAPDGNAAIPGGSVAAIRPMLHTDSETRIQVQTHAHHPDLRYRLLEGFVR